MKRKPFFMVGCVRSGTTFLRDVLRLHPNLASPQETHFFRWADPFGTDGMNRTLTTNHVLKKHRAIDGITEEEFAWLLKHSATRAELYNGYMRCFIKKNKPGAVRWFDKTPQNIYGAAIAAAEFPGAKFIHVVRDPLDVVASLRVGKVVKVESLIGACAYWNEAVEIVGVLKRAYPRLVYEVRYEDLVKDLMPELKKLLAFVGEEFHPGHYADVKVKTRRYDIDGMFTRPELETIGKLCGAQAVRYGYGIGAAAGCNVVALA